MHEKFGKGYVPLIAGYRAADSFWLSVSMFVRYSAIGGKGARLSQLPTN
jgi:hypothetical protein